MRNPSVQSDGSSWSANGPAASSAPAPALPENFLSRLKDAQLYYAVEDEPRLQPSVHHERRVSSMSSSGRDRDNHWINWRERMEQELAQAEHGQSEGN